MCWPRPTDPDVLIFFPNSAPRLAQFPPLNSRSVPRIRFVSVHIMFIMLMLSNLHIWRNDLSPKQSGNCAGTNTNPVCPFLEQKLLFLLGY
jgi:hypothetical protein